MVTLRAAVSLTVALLLFPFAAALAADQLVPTALEALIDEALSNNPGLKAAEQKLDAYRERPLQEESLDNPRLGLGLLNLPVNSFSFDQEPMTQKQVSLLQKIPFPRRRKSS